MLYLLRSLKGFVCEREQSLNLGQNPQEINYVLSALRQMLKLRRVWDPTRVNLTKVVLRYLQSASVPFRTGTRGVRLIG